MDPHIRYVTTPGGLVLAYYVVGRGDRNTVCVMGSTSHLELNLEIPGLRALYERLAGVGRFATFDKRGLGLSDRELGVGDLDDRMDDIRAVMDAARFDEATVVGLSEGGAMAALFAATYPDRVERLVLVGAYPSAGDAGSDLAAIAEASWGTGVLLRAFLGNAPNDAALLGHIERNVATPRGMAQLLRLNARIDVRPILGDIRVPTLVVHDRRDPIVPVVAGRYLARRIPGATLVEVDNGFHWGWGEHDNDDAIDEIVAFITGERPAPPDDTMRQLATVMFTDIEGSTERAVALGDRQWRHLLDRYEEAGRALVRQHRGRWVKSTGDGLLASFDGPGRAVACADGIRASARALGLVTRTGLHTGEVELRGDDVAGLAVHLAARIVAVTEPDGIWVSGTIPGLVIGSGLRFEPRGRHQLKGLPGDVELFAVV